MKSLRLLSASGLRFILSASLFVIAFIGVVIFWIADGQLSRVATDVSHVVVDANASENNLSTLEKIKTELATEQDVVTRAGSIVADSQSYQYQDQIVTDLNNFANKAGIDITNIDFSASKVAAPAAKATVTPSGVKSISVVVTLKNPVNYNNLLRFIESTEQNLTKMQISRIGLSKGATGSDITSDVLTIEVYVK